MRNVSEVVHREKGAFQAYLDYVGSQPKEWAGDDESRRLFRVWRELAGQRLAAVSKVIQ